MGDDQPCSFCTVNGEGGLCVDPAVAKPLTQQNHQISCTNIDVEFSGHTAKSELGISRAYASTLWGEDDLVGPFDVLKCSVEGKTSADKCSVAVNADGEKCDYCTLSENGEEAGLCVDPQIAEKMKEQNPDVSCSNDEVVTKDSQEHVDGPFDVLKCSIQGKTSADKCSVAVNVDGEKCDFCTSIENGEETGLCVDPQIAEKMKQKSSQVSCSNDIVVAEESKDNLNYTNALKCSLEGRTDETKCSTLVNDDGELCSYCKQPWNNREMGECVDPKVAQAMMYGNNKISCTNVEMKTSHYVSELAME